MKEYLEVVQLELHITLFLVILFNHLSERVLADKVSLKIDAAYRHLVASTLERRLYKYDRDLFYVLMLVSSIMLGLQFYWYFTLIYIGVLLLFIFIAQIISHFCLGRHISIKLATFIYYARLLSLIIDFWLYYLIFKIIT